MHIIFFWNRCVYEIYFAVDIDVKVRLAPHIIALDLEDGNTENDICVNQANKRDNSKKARCGAPNTPKNNDEIVIRKAINALGNGFKSVDEMVERIRLIHLVTYPLDEIWRRKSKAREQSRM